MWFGTHQKMQMKDVFPSAHGKILKIKCLRFLGFQVDENEHLRWHNHTELLVNRLSRPSLCYSNVKKQGEY